MVYDFDPRSNRESINSKSYSRRLLEDILTSKIVASMSQGTASNYFTRSYGSNHRILYEGVARLLSGVLVDTLDNLEDLEFSQLRAEFISTRLLYMVFPDENSVPSGDTHEETISFLLKTYEALLKGATKKSIDKVLSDISEGNAVVVSDLEGYIANINSSILATTEFNTDGVFTKHRHFAFTDESGLGSTNKPLEFKWGDKLHSHDIIDGVIQPHVDENGHSHTHNVYLGVPENIVRLQSNLRKVLNVTKPAHIKTGTVSSIIDEDIPILSKNKQDVFSPILGIHPTKSDGDIITENTIDTNNTYHNQNALHGLVGVSLGSLYQEDMRKAREGVYERYLYGYVSGNKIRFWRTNIKVADNLIIGNQKLRVISVSERIKASDDIYDSINDSNGNPYTYKLVRDLRRGPEAFKNQLSDSLEVINGCLYPLNLQAPSFRGHLEKSEILNDGEPIDLRGEIYFCDLMSDNSDFISGDPQTSLAGHTIRLSYVEVQVDAQITDTGLQLVHNNSSTWQTRDQILYETVDFLNTPDPMWDVDSYNYAINLPAYIVKDMLKTVNGLPISIFDLTLKINDQDVDFNTHTLSLEHTNTVENANITNSQDHVMRIFDSSENVLVLNGDKITITYPKAKSEIRRFRELNSIEMTLNAARPSRKVSESGRGIGQNRVIETTSPISYVLNEPNPVLPLVQEQKISTYSAGSSDLLNTQNQNIYSNTKIEDLGSLPEHLLFNSTFTLNNFSLNQSATPEQVFKPATKTITTSNPIVSFYELGFRPQFITSVVDENLVSYVFTLNKDHVLVHSLSNVKTLTISGLSNNPFSSDLDWYRGEKLSEGQAFYKHKETKELENFTESTPEDYMTDPLGLTSDSTIRSIYSMKDTQVSGVEGELTFFEDTITSYKIDGRDGFTNDYNPHVPQDEWLYPNPTLYVLGPLSQAPIITYLFFGYYDLKNFNFDDPVETDYYFSLYRIDAQGVKQYQTLTLITDPNNFDALQSSPNETNGSPIAYRFQDAGGGAFPNSLSYNFDSNVAYANASFYHIPNETYYLEVYFEEAPNTSFLGFFSKGVDTDVNLSDTFFQLQQDLSQNEVYFLTDPNSGMDVSITFEITFTTNPGEVASFSVVADPDNTATKQTETVEPDNSNNVLNNNLPQPVIANHVDNNSLFTPTGTLFTSVLSKVPRLTDEHDVPPMTLAPVAVSSSITFGDDLTTSLLLTPATITESLNRITDDLVASFNYSRIFLDDLVSFSGLFEAKINLVSVQFSDNIPLHSDFIEVPVYQRLLPSSSVPISTDDSMVRWSSYNVSSTIDLVNDELLASYVYLPREVSDSVSISDDVSSSMRFVSIDESDNIPSLSDEAKAFISTFFLSDSVDQTSDSFSSILSLQPVLESDNLSLSDSITVPIYQTLMPSSTVGSITDGINTLIQIYSNNETDDILVSDSLITSMIFTPISETDTVSSTTDSSSETYNYTPITIPEQTPGAKVEVESITFNASAVAFISSTTQTDSTSVSLSDSLTTSIGIVIPSLMVAVKYNGFSDDDNELFSIYKGYMDTLEYPAITDLQPDSNSLTKVGIYNGTPVSAPTITNERYVFAIGPLAYNNTNEDANIRIGPLEFDTDYTIYSYSEYPGDNLDISVALRAGITGSNPTGYLNAVGYTDLFPNASGGTDKYYLHQFYIRSSDNAVIFTPGSPNSFPFGNTDTTPTVRLYIHFKYTYTSSTLDGADFFAIRPALSGWSHSNPNGSPADLTGWIQPDLHDTITGFANAVQGDGTYNYTTLPDFSVSNTKNDAQLSILLEVGVRYQFRCLIDDQDPDFQIYLEARVDDNGASWNTTYSSASNLTYTETVQRNDDGRRDIYHFFTIRRDGFIIWEQDPDSVS